MKILAKVALFSPPFSTLSYALPHYLPASIWKEGQRVAVPLGKGVRSGIITKLEAETKEDQTFTLKSLLWPLEKEPMLKPWYRDLAFQVALRHNTTVGQILCNVLPAGLRTTGVRLRFWFPLGPQEIKVPALAHETPESLDEFGLLWQKGQGDFCTSGSTLKDAELCFLLADPPWPVKPAAKAQTALLEYLLERGAVPRKKLLSALGKSSATILATLVKRNLVGIGPAIPHVGNAVSKSAIYPAPHFTLTESQQKAFDALLKGILSPKAETHLLFGVTGSGKTAVYLELARETLAKGRSVLMLAPEVALALKLQHDVQSAFPDLPLVLFHGYLPAAAKERIFKQMTETTNPVICVGTRSALFLPLENIGMIILDEEHDSSFKQDEGFTYQAKEIAWYRAGKSNALLLLGSATPDLKSFQAARDGKIKLHQLDTRVGGGELPDVALVVLPKTQTNGILVQESLDALRQTVEDGNQAVILLNRRGYAPLMYCLGCGTVAKCPHCDIGLAYHKGRERLVCHYCGYAIPFPSPCSFCKSMNFLPMGEGTERIEESLSALLPPGAGVLRLDRDSTRRPGKMEDILASFAKKEASVLVGTQMLSKGHHFPDVTLAIVADADLGLNLPDYRAAERTFQLLVQSSGRAGRGAKKGRVIIQTRNPSHYCWDFVKSADYEGFFSHEIQLRERRLYPPFIHLALIRISHEMGFDGTDEVFTLATILRATGKELGVTVLGPAPAPLPFLKGRKRFHCLAKSPDWQKLRSLFTAAQKATQKGHLRVTLDLDPVNML